MTDTAKLSDQELLLRSVRLARVGWGLPSTKRPRWIAVAECFSISAGDAADLCRRFGFDPDEKVSRA